MWACAGVCGSTDLFIRTCEQHGAALLRKHCVMGLCLLVTPESKSPQVFLFFKKTFQSCHGSHEVGMMPKHWGLSG